MVTDLNIKPKRPHARNMRDRQAAGSADFGSTDVLIPAIYESAGVPS
jgi:hypothetical protein